MSASREKRARQSAQTQKPVESTPKKSKKNVLIGIAITLVIVLLIGSIVLFKGPYFTNHTVAAIAGEHELTPTLVHYYYVDEFSKLRGDYADLFPYMFEDLDNVQDDIYDPVSGQTWGEYVLDIAMNQLAVDYAVYDEAVKAGYEMSEDGLAQLDENRYYVELYASIYDISPDAYIRTVYGSGASQETYGEYQRVKILAYEYSNAMRDSFSYDAAQIAAADEADPTLYNHYTYHSYLLTPTAASSIDSSLNVSADASEEEQAAAMDAAKTLAEEMAAATEGDLDAFLTYAALYSGSQSYRDGSVSIREGYTAADVPAEAREWVTAADRAEGDTFCVETSSGYYVLYFVESNDNDYEAKNIRMITVSAASTDADGNAIVDWESAQNIVNTMDTTVAESTTSLEETFIGLAAGYSSDSDTVSTGGLYENVYRGQLNDVVDAWLFGGEAVENEVVCLQGLDAFYYVYLIGDAGNYRDILIEQTLCDADYDAWYEGVKNNAYVQRVPEGMKYVDLTTSFSDDTTTDTGLLSY